MRRFTPETAEQVISLLCYSRTEDTYYCGCPRKSKAGAGAFRLAVTSNRYANRLALSDKYDSLSYQTVTVESAIQKGLLEPSWEDLATKLYLNDQDVLYMCLMSSDEPVCLRLIEAERIIAYRNRHNGKDEAKKFTYLPGQSTKHLRISVGKAKCGHSDRERIGKKGAYDPGKYAA